MLLDIYLLDNKLQEILQTGFTVCVHRRMGRHCDPPRRPSERIDRIVCCQWTRQRDQGRVRPGTSLHMYTVHKFRYKSCVRDARPTQSPGLPPTHTHIFAIRKNFRVQKLTKSRLWFELELHLSLSSFRRMVSSGSTLDMRFEVFGYGWIGEGCATSPNMTINNE